MSDEERYSIKEVIERRFDDMETHFTEIKDQIVTISTDTSSLKNSRTQIWTAILVIMALGSAFVALGNAWLTSKIQESLNSPSVKESIKGIVVEALQDNVETITQHE